MTSDVAAYWDAQAARFDDEPDHGLGAAPVRAAWAALLGRLVPPRSLRVVDLGCGTGSLSVLLATSGHRVTGVDLSPQMLAAAATKAERSGVQLDLRPGDISAPQLAPASYDVVLARHVVWALPDPGVSLRRWVDLLAPGGRLVLVEGVWSTGAGLPADTVVGLLEADLRLGLCAVERLDDPQLWGGPITDDRYAVVADLAPDPLLDSLPDNGSGGSESGAGAGSW